MSEIVVACACCGRSGKLVGAGSDARVRCVLHAHVVDAGEWLRVQSAMTCAFESEEELMAYFGRDYGAGLDLMQDLERKDDDDTRH